MPLFRRRRAPRPEWAGPLGDDELDAFTADLRAELDRRGWTYEIGDDALRVSEPALGELGLHNVAQVHRGVEPAERAGIVRLHFDNLLAAQEEETPKDFAVARPMLRVRLMPPYEEVRKCAFRALEEDLVAVLVLDTPEAVRFPTRVQVEAWGRGEDELFDIALAAVRGEEGLETHVQEHQGARIVLLAGDSYYAATWAIWAGELDAPASEHGAIVAVPHRHAVLVHAIRDLSVVPALGHMAQIAASMHAEGPGSISSSVYWWRDGRFDRVEITVTDGNMSIAPSDELLAVLNSLG
jgi:hypothetical protein